MKFSWSTNALDYNCSSVFGKKLTHHTASLVLNDEWFSQEKKLGLKRLCEYIVNTGRVDGSVYLIKTKKM